MHGQFMGWKIKTFLSLKSGCFQYLFGGLRNGISLKFFIPLHTLWAAEICSSAIHIWMTLISPSATF